MAIVGISTAWGAVKRAISIVQQYNPQIVADFEYMRYCIANLLMPAIQGLIKLLYTVLSYVNAIVSAWFGINLFGNSSVKNFQKMQKSASGTAKSAKEIQKSLQGFDEMNILQDDGSMSENSGVGVSTPSMDLSGIQGDIPQWLKWIIDNKDLMLQLIAGVVSGIIALKLGLSGIQALGIGIAVSGIISLIQNIITFIQDPTWENFSNILLSISVILAGIALVVGGTLGTTIASISALIAGIALIIQGVISYLNDPTWENFITILGGIAIVVGAVLLLIGGIPALITGIILLIAAIGLAVYKHWDEICQLLGKVGQWIYDNIIKPVGDFFANLWNGICEIFSNVGTWFSNTFNSARDGVINAFTSIGQFFQNIWQSICNAFSEVGYFFTSVFSNAYESIKRIFSSIGSFFSGIWSGIVSIFRNIGQKIGEAVSGAFRGAVNAVLSTIENILNTPIRAVNSLIGVINLVPGINLGRLPTFNLPRLAKGGIISQPTQAIIGEAGKEAVVPLENNMEWLDILADKLANKIGSSGGSYIINMDSRTIQRGIAKRGQEIAFAKNGR
ncbi:MAG: hypothetical protein HFJ26_08710 [Clostridia bacterium]|nr:hypothetical protein [Clostridia bacterium]